MKRSDKIVFQNVGQNFQFSKQEEVMQREEMSFK